MIKNKDKTALFLRGWGDNVNNKIGGVTPKTTQMNKKSVNKLHNGVNG